MAIASGVCERGADGNHLDNASLDPRDDDTLKRLQVPTTEAGVNPERVWVVKSTDGAIRAPLSDAVAVCQVF